VVDRLSGGERQALTLALSVLYPPSILLMDEHTSALDPKAAQQLMMLTQRVVTEHRITCLLTTHDLDIALEYGNRILALRQGEVFHSIENDKKTGLSQQDLLAVCY
jgi:putative ABC transport system ATP-binding protein